MNRRFPPLPYVVAALVAIASAPLAAQRELHWRELDVRARLESDGTLAVSERHAMVFTGDWNGGERVFDLRFGQVLELDGVWRLEPATGEWRRIERGSLDEVDRWNWSDSHSLRWRSRRPSDPEFASTEIGYRLDYRLRGILKRHGDLWRLDHDFAFPDRFGEISRFVLELELAPEWSSPQELATHVDTGPLPPGASHVVTAELAYEGSSEPEHAGLPHLPFGLRAGALLAAALGSLGLFRWAVQRERAIGRLAPLEPIDTIDRAWFERHVLALPPEEVGAAWDDTIGAAEVAAMLARLQLEGKLASRVESKRVLFTRQSILHLSLEVDRSELAQAERKLVDGLFPEGDETDTETLRKHYRTSGFDPASKIKSVLLDRLGDRPGFGGARPRPARRPSVILIVAGAAALALAAVVAPGRALAPIALGVVLIVTWIPSIVGALLHRNRVAGFAGPNVAIAVGQIDGLAALALLPLLPQTSATALAGGVLLFLGLARSAATAMQTRQSEARIARKRELARARAWLAAELRRSQPQLDDAWVPYLVAFGLATEMDRWFRAFGGAADVAARTGAGGSSWSGSSAGGGWSGGGGAFGGAGATASWALAATSMSAGVAAASSGSSGGGGGGGGSSGGGGGGGW